MCTDARCEAALPRGVPPPSLRASMHKGALCFARQRPCPAPTPRPRTESAGGCRPRCGDPGPHGSHARARHMHGRGAADPHYGGLGPRLARRAKWLPRPWPVAEATAPFRAKSCPCLRESAGHVVEGVMLRPHEEQPGRLLEGVDRQVQLGQSGMSQQVYTSHLVGSLLLLRGQPHVRLGQEHHPLGQAPGVQAPDGVAIGQH